MAIMLDHRSTALGKDFKFPSAKAQGILIKKICMVFSNSKSNVMNYYIHFKIKNVFEPVRFHTKMLNFGQHF